MAEATTKTDGLSCTDGQTIAQKKYKKEYGKKIIVTNQFVKMMDEALKGALKVLEKRKKDLATWGDKEKDEFSRIMGIDVKNNDTIMFDHEYYRCDIENAAKEPLSPKKLDTTTVIEFMRKSVDRMHYIMSELHVDAVPVKVSTISPCSEEAEVVPDKTVYKYGNFVNRTYTSEYSAFVERNATFKYYPEEYKTSLEIHIGYGFKEKDVMGEDSRVSTLCHEVSHFYRVEHINASEEDREKSKGPWGGVGTDDLPNDKDYKHVTGETGGNVYDEYKDKLKEEYSLDVFRNAYNFELYFELTKEECEVY
ncbi:hypothetical protein [Escherichia sp. TW15838]|uniref:hypothetical protein n=1 Tax=Escherichia sp. TW15838 TaxID=910237 RepID=UPI0002D81C4C|nr:hypothetical protein [Escherichia sp. TW15838]